MKFAHFFIDRPVFAAVLSIVTIIAGVLSIFSLPISQYPEIAPPTVTVSTSYPGANAKTVSDTVAAPIEQQINGVENMLYMSSQCTNDGNMNLTVTFKVGTNLDTAQVQVQNRIAIAQPQLPQEVQQRGITVKKASPDITLVVGFFSPDRSRDPIYLSNYVTLQVRDQISRVPGVGDINQFGARDYSMRIWLDPEKLSSRRMIPADVVTAVKEQNIQVAAGIVGGPPIPAGATDFQYTLSAQGRLTEPEQFENIIVRTGEAGAITRLKDVARVELGAADYATAILFNGQPAVGLAIFQLPGTNAIETANAVYKRMEELKARFPSGVDYAISYDTTLFVRDSLHDVVHTLLVGIALVVIVVLVFLQNWRTSLVPLLAIPVSLIGTFAVMWAFGFSMNNLSLFGLVLAIGIVVDDAIVVVENVERWIEEGLSPRDAAFRAMDEVTPAVIAIAFGLSAVFIPVAFVSGITGQFYRQFALTISFSTLLSALNSLTLSPALSALLLRPKQQTNDVLTRFLNSSLGWFFRIFNSTYEKSSGLYLRSLTKVVRSSGIALFVYLLMIVLAYAGFRSVPTGFIPPQDQGSLFVNVQLPDGASINRGRDVMEKVAHLVKSTPGVRAVFAIAGFSIISRSNSSSSGAAFISLKPFSERSGHPELSLNSIMKRLNGEFAKIPEATVLAILPPPVRGIGSAGGFKVQVQNRSGFGTPQDLQLALDRLISEARKRPELTSVFTSYRANQPQLFAEIDREKAKMKRIPVTHIFEALQVYLGGLYINDFNYLGRTWRVIAQADSQFRQTASDVGVLKTRNLSGEMVPLGSVMNLKDTTGPDRIQRFNLYPSAEVNGTTAPGYSSGQALAVIEEVANSTLPPGYAFEWTEMAFQEKMAGNSALWIFPLCILFVWLTHSAEYESFALSTAIILIVPMCLLCGIAGVWIRGMDNNIFTQIGFVVLAGISVKNAVLIVEFAKQQQEHHPELSAAEAVIEASRLRLRPILMTSFAFIFGVLPLITATGAGSEMRQALGTAVFFGMLGVTFFGIYLTPVFYKVIAESTARFKRLFSGTACFLPWCIAPLPLFLSGCLVGPDYIAPASNVPGSFSRGAEGKPADLARWWKAMNDPLLDALIERAVDGNLDMKVAASRLRQAHAERMRFSSGLLPSLDTDLSGNRSRSSYNSAQSRAQTVDNTGSNVFQSPGTLASIFRAGIDASWEIDLFGGGRRAIEAAVDTEEAAMEAERDILVSLLAEVALQYVQLRGLQFQKQIADKNVKVESETLDVQRTRLEAGIASELTVSQVEAQLANTRAEIPSLLAQIQQRVHRLSTLLGREPAMLQSELLVEGPLPDGPSEVPPGFPVEVLRQRPDVRQAERLYAAETARVGVARSELYPGLNLTGAFGLQTRNFDTLVKGSSFFWNANSILNWPLFSGGRISANIEIQEERREQAFLQYQLSVLNALREVEDALSAHSEEQKRLLHLREAVRANEHSLRLAQQLYDAGVVEFLNILTAEQSLFESERQMAISQQSVSQNLIALYKALGGGWQEKIPRIEPNITR